mmetsp:Transcript_66210/g.110573  ORF Transcript_66210/g.110573 Transcript_66210/m.110573 type:complete len:89 (+) Transcript_66210:793-1059(+)
METQDIALPSGQDGFAIGSCLLIESFFLEFKVNSRHSYSQYFVPVPWTNNVTNHLIAMRMRTTCRTPRSLPSAIHCPKCHSSSFVCQP